MRAAALLALAAVGCGTRAAPAPSASGAATAAAKGSAPAPARREIARGAGSEPPPVEISARAIPAGSAGLCGPADGPFDVKRRGAPALALLGDDVALILNDAGKPDVRAFPARPGAPRLDGPSGEKASAIACAAAAGQVFCPDKDGVVRRATLDARGAVGEAEPAARSRPGSPIAAAPLGGRAVLAYLVDAVGPSGPVTEAWVALPGKPAKRLSDDGSGATFVALAPRGSEVVAMYVDAHAGLTPIHARVLELSGDDLALGADAVLHVGGPFERYTTGALGVGAAATFALVPLSVDDRTFALGAFRVDARPKDEAEHAWSKYPNGLDPAPVAATFGRDVVTVALARPESADPKAQRVLELGRLDERGVFLPACTLDVGAQVTHVAVVTDASGAHWIAWSGSKGTFLARRGAR